jgi:DUF438 domain-containing protein
MHSLPVLPNPAPKLLESLPENHLLRDLILEHEQLVLRLDELDHLATDLSLAPDVGRARAIAERMRSIAVDLLHAEPHHQREEQVLFPELERRGVIMPPRMMRREHEELRVLKKQLLESVSASTPDRAAAGRWAHLLSEMLRAHILKENEILFPMAWSAVRDPALWDRMRAAAVAFGPCCSQCGCNGKSAGH